MLWSSLFNFCLLSSAVLQILTAAGSIVTHEAQFPTKNPFTVAIGSQLLTVSRYSKRIVVNSTDANFKSCDIAINTNEEREIKAVAIDSKKIIVWNKKGENPAPGTDKTAVKYTILLVNPWECSVKEVKSPTDLIPSLTPIELPRVVVRKDNTFDVFYWSYSICSPCRFDIEGRRIQLQHSLKPEPSIPINFRLQELSDDHKYVYIFDNGSVESTLKVLDQDFNVLDSTHIRSFVGDFAIRNVADTSYIGVIQNIPDDPFAYNYTLLEYKFKLQPVFSKLLKRSSGYRLVSADPKIDSKGNSYLTMWQVINGDGTKITVTRYDPNGQLIGDTLEIGNIAIDEFYKVQTFLLQNNRYCLVVHVIGWKSDVTKIKCFDVYEL